MGFNSLGWVFRNNLNTIWWTLLCLPLIMDNIMSATYYGSFTILIYQKSFLFAMINCALNKFSLKCQGYQKTIVGELWTARSWSPCHFLVNILEQHLVIEVLREGNRKQSWSVWIELRSEVIPGTYSRYRLQPPMTQLVSWIIILVTRLLDDVSNMHSSGHIDKVMFQKP